jgi:AcrR family transcriptional regulator
MPRKAAFDRHAALERAMILFWTRGYAGASLKDIEAALDMRPGSIYAAFGSKEKLFRSVLTLYAERSRAALSETLSQAASSLQGLADHVRKLGRALEAQTETKACMLMKTVLESPDAEGVLRAAAEDMMRQTEEAFRDAFQAARDTGQIPADKDPARLASRLQSEILGLSAYAQRSDASGRIGDLSEDIARDLEAMAT